MSDEERLDRRRTMAGHAVREYEDQLSALELVLIRLDSLPVGLREQNHDEVRKQAKDGIARVGVILEAMRQHATL